MEPNVTTERGRLERKEGTTLNQMWGRSFKGCCTQFHNQRLERAAWSSVYQPYQILEELISWKICPNCGRCRDYSYFVFLESEMTTGWVGRLGICCALGIGWGLGRCIPFWWLNLPMKNVRWPNLVVDYLSLHAVMAVVAELVGAFEGTLNFAWWSGPWAAAEVKLASFNTRTVGIAAYLVGTVEIAGVVTGAQDTFYEFYNSAGAWDLILFELFGVW